jgi:hypothetical protein
MSSFSLVDQDVAPLGVGEPSAIERVEALRAALAANFVDTAGTACASDVVARVAAATALLHDVDPVGLDARTMREWLEGVERVRRTVDAAAVAAAGAVDRSNPFRSRGFFTAKSVVKHMCRLSGPEAHRRVQTARLHDALPPWADAEAEGHVGVAQSELMARIVANPRLPAGIVERDSPALLDDAINLPFDEFERQVRTWEVLADPDGDRTRNDRQHANRDVRLRPRPEGGWTLTGNLAELAGCEFMEIFSWFCEAQWRADWADARARLGDAATTADLTRSEAQRRADALLAMARAAASTPSDARSPRPTVNILIDQESFEAHLRGETPDPSMYRSVVVRTQTGRRLHPDDAVNAALIGHIRRAVYDTSGTIIDLGRRARLFRGSSRDAVMLLLTTCVWVGCDRPIGWCDADHSLGWKAHGATVPRNGGGLCEAHNHLKERGFRVFRDHVGRWHVIDPDGSEIT